MRQLILAGFLACLFSGATAFADTAPAQTENTPTCMQVVLDQKPTMACFDLSDEQVQNLQGGNEYSEQFRHCRIRCEIIDRFGRCLRWRRICWPR